MCFRLVFISAKHRIFHDIDANLAPSYSFSCLTAYMCVFCRNEENETKSKIFGQYLKNLCKEEVVVATIGFYGHDHRSMQEETTQQLCSVVVTIEDCLQQPLAWSQPHNYLV